MLPSSLRSFSDATRNAWVYSIHFLSKVFLLLVNEVASRLVSLHGHGLRSGLDLLDRRAPLLPSSTLQGLNFFFCGLCGLLRSLLQTTARGWRCFGRF